MGQAVLYDNLDHVWSLPRSGPKNVLWIGTGGKLFPEEEYRFLAASPFHLGGHDNISSVSIPMGLEDSTPAGGSFRVALWNSNGAGLPGEKVAELGAVDLSELQVVGDFDIPASAENNGQQLPVVTFESPIQGLASGETYFVVLDFDDLPVSPHGAVLGLTNSASGANGAGAFIQKEISPSPTVGSRPGLSRMVKTCKCESNRTAILMT